MTGFDSDDKASRDLWTGHRSDRLMHETGLVMPRKGAIRKFIRRSMMTAAGRTADIARSPDRAVLRRVIFPEAAAQGGNILFVGTQPYTIGYPAELEAGGGQCWTIDCNPKAARFGASQRHIVGSILDLEDHLPQVRFRTIILAGVFGFGVNRHSHQVKALQACAHALEPDGFLILGWNDRRVSGTVLEEAAARWFDYRTFGDLPSRLWVRRCDQNFAFLRRSADRISGSLTAQQGAEGCSSKF